MEKNKSSVSFFSAKQNVPSEKELNIKQLLTLSSQVEYLKELNGRLAAENRDLIREKKALKKQNEELRNLSSHNIGDLYDLLNKLRSEKDNALKKLEVVQEFNHRLNDRLKTIERQNEK